VLLVLPALGAAFTLAACARDKTKALRVSAIALISIIPLYGLVSAVHVSHRNFTKFGFGIPAADYFVGKGFSKEDPGVLLSWIIDSPAELHGRLPKSDRVNIEARVYNPHPDQTVEIDVNGRAVGRWNLPVGYSEPATMIDLLPEEVGKVAIVGFRVGEIAPFEGGGESKRGIMLEWVDIKPAGGG
jgi:hypothetical protein